MRPNSATAKLFSGTKECLHASTSWPTRLSEQKDVAGTPEFVDASCSGSTISSGQGWWLVHEVAEAAKQQAFGPEVTEYLDRLDNAQRDAAEFDHPLMRRFSGRRVRVREKPAAGTGL